MATGPTRLGLLLPLAAALAGCGGPAAPSGPEAYVPPPELARAALVAALEAWRAGRPVGTVTTMRPAVEVSDNERPPGRPLRAFEVLGPVGPGDARGFAVRLTLDDPPEEQLARYLVVGRDPLWVFRQEDYERISHWEHKMDPEADEEPAPAPTPDRRDRPNAPEPDHEHP